MNRAAFIVSKPIQILIALNLAEQIDALELVTLIIVDEFHGAEDVYNEFRDSSYFASKAEFEFVSTKSAAFKRIANSKIHSIFIDSDVGVRNYAALIFLKGLRGNLEINVFEEGIGTYRRDLYCGWKKFALDSIGAGTHFGGASVTENIYVFDHSAYCDIFDKDSMKAKPIRGAVMDYLDKHSSELARVFSYRAPESSGANNCHVYLSSWRFSQRFFIDFGSAPGDLFVKPHPHTRLVPEWVYGTIVSATVPSELVINDLSSKYSSVSVYHHGSSSEFYIRRNNVNFVKIFDAKNG
ncbi:hypothetical protein [Sulfitobacter sp. 1A13679]|uniref:hypothetical protein n=1 Tax=Sulfitobacter sp. 1A13679 TaxID=3368597 RepID=UPI003747091B